MTAILTDFYYLSLSVTVYDHLQQLPKHLLLFVLCYGDEYYMIEIKIKWLHEKRELYTLSIEKYTLNKLINNSSEL